VFFTNYQHMGQIFWCKILKKAPSHAVVGVLHQLPLRTSPKLHHPPNDEFFLAVFAVLNTYRHMPQIFRCETPKKAPSHAVVGGFTNDSQQLMPHPICLPLSTTSPPLP
jgi:hypothetical protein